MSLFDKLSLRSSSYVAVIGCSNRLVADVYDTVRGVVSIGDEKVHGVRNMSDVSKLETSAFDRILYRWKEPKSNPLVECIRACEPQGLVLMHNVPFSSKRGLVSYLERKGIYNWWFSQDKAGVGDLIFKVQKHSDFQN